VPGPPVAPLRPALPLARDVLGPPLPAGQAPYYFASSSSTVGGTNRAITVAVATQPGDTLLASASVNNTTAALSWGTDPRGNTWTLDGSFSTASPTGWFWRCDGATGGPGGGPSAAYQPGDVINITVTGGTGGTVATLMAGVPAAASGGLDLVTAVQTAGNNSVYTASVTPAADGELLILMQINQATGGTPKAARPWWQGFSSVLGPDSSLIYQVGGPGTGGVSQSCRVYYEDTVNSRGIFWAFKVPQAAPPVIQQAGPFHVRSLTTTGALSLPQATGTGNTLVACVTTNGTTANPLVSGITLGASADHWASAHSFNSATRNNTEIWADPGAASGQTQVTVNFTGGGGTGDLFVSLYEVAGTLTADQVAHGEGNAAGFSVQTAPYAQPAEIAFGAVITTGSQQPQIDPPWNSQPYSYFGTYDHQAGYQQQTVDGWPSQATLSGTINARAVNWTAAVATFYVTTATPVSLADVAAGADDLTTVPIQAAVPLPEVGGAADALTASAAVPEADAAAATEQLSASAAVPLADPGAGAEALAVSAAVPVADAAGAAESLSVQVSVPLADAAGAADKIVPAAAVPLADAAAGAEAIDTSQRGIALADAAAAAEAPQVAAAVPLADAAAAADAPAVAAAVPLADAGAAAESMTSGMPVALAEAAGAADSLSVSVSVPLAEAAGAADVIAPAAAVPLADAGSGIESLDTSQRGIALADTAAAAETVQVSAAVPLAESGAAADTAAVSAAIPLADRGAAAEQQAVSAAIPVSDAAAAVDAVAENAAVPLADQAAGADAISVPAAGQPNLADAAGAAEALAVAAQAAESDSAGAADALSASAQVPLGDAAGAAEALSVAVSVPLHDAAAGADALSVAQAAQPALADAAGATDALSAAVAASSHDVAAASDALAVSRNITLTDSAAAADSLVYSVPPAAALPTWEPGPAEGWRPRPAAGVLLAPARPGWDTRVEPPRWAVSALPVRWKAMASFEPIAAISGEQVNVSWLNELPGDTTDPTSPTAGLAAQFAFPLSSGDENHPAEPASWVPGTWLASQPGYKGYIAQVTVGPTALGGVLQLAAGQAYDVWAQIGTVRKFVGPLKVY